MTKHAVLSPSSASRWMQCPGSVVLSQGAADSSSEFADEGTAAHQVAAWCLAEPGGKVRAAAFVGRIIEVGQRSIEVTEEMAEHVQTYVDRVLDLAGDAPVLAEQAVPISHLTGEADAEGTSDAIVLPPGELQVHDLKYGRGVKVDADDNPQLKLYALGAMEQFGVAHDFDRVRLFIHQPRLDHVSEWAISVDDLLVFAERVRVAARMVTAARESSADELEQNHLRPSEDACRWCKAKATCPALARQVQDDVGADFEDISAGTAEPVVPPDGLHTAMNAVGMIEDWCKAVRAEVERRLFAGTPVPGYKLVEGRKGARAWSDADAAEAMLRKQFRLPVEQAYKLTLISPPAAEKLLAKDSPRRWHKLQPLITQTKGQPSVAPAADTRPAWSPEPAENDFEDLTAAEALL